MALQKEYLCKIYGSDGITLKATVSQANLAGGKPPSFRSRINGGQGECVLDITGGAYKFDAYGEGTIVRHSNVVELWVVDAAHMLGRRVYKGYISRYQPYLKDTGEEGVQVTCLGLGSLLTRSYYKNGSSFTVTQTTQDPTVIAKAIADHFGTIYSGSLITYDSSSIPATVGTNVTYSFVDQKWLDAMNTTVKLAGTNWWWFIDQDGKLQFQAKPSSAKWTFAVGLEISGITATKDAEAVINDVEVRRSGGTATDYSDATSQSTYGTGSPQTGKNSEIISDTNITDSGTADARGNAEIGSRKDAKTSAVITLNPLADLEGIRMGDAVQIANRNKSDTTYPSSMQIVSMNYTGDDLTIELEAVTHDFGAALQFFVNS
jgi:hypothetical protein